MATAVPRMKPSAEPAMKPSIVSSRVMREMLDVESAAEPAQQRQRTCDGGGRMKACTWNSRTTASQAASETQKQQDGQRDVARAAHRVEAALHVEQCPDAADVAPNSGVFITSRGRGPRELDREIVDDPARAAAS